MPLWLEQLLEDPGLGLRPEAGYRGLRARGPIQWAHISELPDPTPFLQGGELLLTLGFGIRGSSDLQRALVRKLDEHGCVGLGFGVGPVFTEVPPAMAEEADRRDLPLFSIPYELPFCAITKTVSRHIFDEHYATLRQAVNLHRRVLAEVLRDAGISGVIETVGAALPAMGLVVFDYYGSVLATCWRDKLGPSPEPDALWAAVNPHQQTRDRFTVELEALHINGCLVRVGEHVEAVLAGCSSGPLGEPEQILFEQALTGVSLELARERSVRELHRSRVEELLDEIAAGHTGSRLLVERLQRLGLDPDLTLRVLCFLRRGPVPRESDLCALIENTLGPLQSFALVGRHDEAVYCIVDEAVVDHADALLSTIAARGWTAVAVGQSGPKQGFAELDQALAEARAASACSVSGVQSLTSATDLGLVGLVAGLGGKASIESFVRRMLGPLFQYDLENDTRLLETLAVYVHHGCRSGPAAEELFIHRNTLTYRLNQIGELTGRDLRRGDDLVEIGLALQFHGSGVGTGAGRRRRHTAPRER